MTGETTVSFDEFAASENLTIRGICQMCALPTEAKEQVQHAWDTGYRATAIVRYLAALGHEVGPNSVHNHFSRGHKL